MCEQTEIKYMQGDIVWVKLNSLWWPGEVVNIDNIPNEMQLEVKKKSIISIVKFFDEDKYELVKSFQLIRRYDCFHKEEYIQKGLDKFRTKGKEGYMKKFPEDVEMAEKLSGGNINILSDKKYIYENKPDTSNLFGKKKHIKQKKPYSETSLKKKINKINKTKINQASNKISYGINICKQPNLLQHNNYNEKTYPCPSCHYVASRVNVIIYHIKSHKFNNNMLDKKKLKFRKKIKHSQVSLDFTKQKNEKKSLFNDITVSNNDDSRIGKRKRVKEVEKSLKKKKTHPELKEKLLADWNDEFDESEDLKHKNQTSLELESNKLNKNNNDLMIDTDIILKETELFVKYSKINESKKYMKEKENENFIEKNSENFLNIENTSLNNENLKLDKEKSKLSCFDFDEDEITESRPNMSSVRKLSENKIVQLNKKIINEFEKTNLKNKVLKKRLKIVEKKNLDFEENFKIAKKEELNIFLKDSLRTNKNKNKDDTHGALKCIALSADTTPAESSSVIDKYDPPLKIASTEISEDKKKLNTKTTSLIGQNDSLKLIAENSFHEKYSLNDAEKLHFLTLNEDNGSDKIGINKMGLDQQTDKKCYPFIDEYKKSNSELKDNLKDDSVSSNKNSISEIFIGKKKVTKQLIEKTLNEISEKNSFELKKKFCDNSLDSDIDINIFPASLSKKKEYDLIPAKNNLNMEFDENTCKSSNLTTSNIQCKGALSPNQFQKIKTDLSLNEFYFKDEKQCITSFDLFKNPNEKNIATAENNLGLTEENSVGIVEYNSIFSKDKDKKEISKEVAFDAKNVLEIECNINSKIKDLDRQNSLKSCPSTILTKNIYNLDIEKGTKNEENFSNDNQTSTYNPLKIGIKEPKSLVLNDENFESTKLEIGKVTEFDEKNDNISLVNMYMDKKSKNPKEYSLIEIKTSGYTVPVKKREKPRIIENVALKEPMIFKQKHLEKSTEKFIKNQIENVSNIEKSVSINSTRIDNSNSGINKSTENADLLSDISKTEIKLIKTLNCSVPNILDNSIDSTPFVPKCEKDSQLLNSASQILGDIDLDINSMPFVMQEDLLEPVNLEHFPVVVSSALNTSIPNVSSKLILTNANKQPLIIKPSKDISSSKSNKKKSITPTILKNKTKSRPTITSIKTIIPPIVSIENNSKMNAVPTISVANNQNTISGKYVIVQAGRQQAQYSVQAKGGTISKSCATNRKVSENTQIVQQGGKVVILGPQISNFTPADRLQENIANKGKALIQTPILLNSKSSIQLNNINCSPRNNTKFDCQKILNSVSIIDKSSANMKPKPHEDLQKNNTGLPYTSSIMPSISSLSPVFSTPTITSNVAHYHKIKTKNVLESPTQVHSAKTMLTTQNLIQSKGPKFKPITRQQVKAIAAQHPKDLKIQKKITISQKKLQSSSSNSFNDQTNSSNFLHGNMILLNKNEECITETTCSNKKQEKNKNLLHNNSEEKIQIEKINIKSNQPKTNKNNINEKNESDDVPIDWNIESTKPQIADTKTINVNIISSQETNVKEKETNKIKVVPEFNLDLKAKNILKLEIEPASKNKSETSIIYDTNDSPTCLIPVVNEISDKKQSLYVLVYNDQDQMQTLDSSFYDHSSNLRDSNDFDGLVVNLASDADNKKSKNIINALSLNESQSTNQDILAVALANTDFQNEIEIEEVTESNVISSNLTPTSLINQTILQSTIIPPMDPITSPSVSETSLTLNQPIMSPVEIRSNLSQTSMIIKSKNTNNLINLNNQTNPLDNESKTSETKTQESKANWLSTANEMCSENTTVPTKNLLPSKDINEEIKNIDTLSHQNSTQDNQKVEGNCYILPTQASEKVLLKPDFNILTENQSTIFLESSNNLSNEEFQNSSYKFLFKSQIDSSEDKLEKIVETKDENITNIGFKNKKITLFKKEFSEDSSKNYNNLIGERTNFLKDSNVFETHKNIEISKNKSDDKNKAVTEILNDNEGKLTNTTLIDNNNLPFIVQVSKLGTEMEDSNETNQNVIYNQESNSQVNNIIGSSTSVNNLLVNEDEIAGSSYIPETPENQERDQDQESAISTSSYEIPPCEDLNITSGTEIPSSCIQIVHHSSNNDIFGNTDSSFNSNNDISSSTDLLPTSCYHDEIVIEANESSYEIPIAMQHIEETIPKSFILNSTENSNDETDYYSDQRKNQGNFYSLCKEQSGSQVLGVESENFFINNENLRTPRQYFNDANEGESSFSHQQVMTENFFQNQANVEPNEDYFSNQNLLNINEPTVQNIDSVQTYFKNSGNQITSQQELMPSYTENYEVASSEILQNQKATAKEN